MQHEIVSKNSTELTRWLSGTIGPLERGLGQVLSHQIRDLKPSGNIVHDNVPVLHRLMQQVELGRYVLCATRRALKVPSCSSLNTHREPIGDAPGGRVSIVTRSATSWSLRLWSSFSMAFFHFEQNGDVMACLKVLGIGIDAGGTSGAVALDDAI